MLIDIFCCYARKDQRLLKKLQTHLSPLERQGLIKLFADTDIDAGLEWEEELEKHLNTAHIILLLVSPDFIASNYCYSKEMKRAMDRHDAKEAQVVPVILRPVLWEKVLFGKLQALPKDAIPVTGPGWHNSDTALYDVAKGIERISFKLSRELDVGSTQEAKQVKRLRTRPEQPYHIFVDVDTVFAFYQKVNPLEAAVRLIEATILHNSPAPRNAGVSIEPRKIVLVNGIRYEIDLYVTVDDDKDYRSVFIFECKNWEKAVRASEIAVFSARVGAVGAQRGFFVARSFTKNAEEQAKGDGRIELLTASTMLDTLPPFIDDFHYVYNNIVHADIKFACITDDPKRLGKLNFTDESKVRFKGEDLLLPAFNQRVQRMVESEYMNHEPTETYKEGIYPYEVTKLLTFQPNELLVDGYECREIIARVQWNAQIIRPKIVSQFDSQTRGRIISFESDQLPSGSIKA